MVSDKVHKTMAANKSKDTKPEILVRKFLWHRGFRYRLNHKRLPGKPDIVLFKYRTCIFINGCFWHGHENCSLFSMPKSNNQYWKPKIARNKHRDKEVQHQLAEMGWHCITIWECKLKPNIRQTTLDSLVFTLNKIFLDDHRIKRYELPEDESPMMVAEYNEIDYGVSLRRTTS